MLHCRLFAIHPGKQSIGRNRERESKTTGTLAQNTFSDQDIRILNYLHPNGPKQGKDIEAKVYV